MKKRLFSIILMFIVIVSTYSFVFAEPTSTKIATDNPYIKQYLLEKNGSKTGIESKLDREDLIVISALEKCFNEDIKADIILRKYYKDENL